MGKLQIQQLCIQYTHNITGDMKRSIESLEKDLSEIQDLAYTTGNMNDIENLTLKKRTLADFLGSKVQGALVRSRFQSVEQMDVSSKFFFNLEKKNGQRRFIHALRGESGAVLSDVSDRRKRAVQFYKDLYRSELNSGRVINNAFLDGLPQVSAESLSVLDATLSMGEPEKALQGMECGKALGLDGIPVEFYKAFWEEVGGDLLAVLNDSIAGGLLPVSCRRAVLTLLPKKGDLTDIRNWRSLL